MSGVVKGIKKVFKAVVKVVKKVAKPLMIAAAVYFTGGLALSAFPATAGFAASLPGFGIASSGAATGIFSKAASAVGLSGGLQAGAAANAVAAGTATTVAAAGAATTAAAGAASTAAGVGAAATGMSLTNKLLLASMGTKAIGSFLAPTTDEVYEAQRKWRGAYYGVEGDGKQLMPEQPQQATPQQQTKLAQPAALQTPTLPDAQRRQPVAQDSPAPQGEMPTAQPKRQLMNEAPVSNDPITLNDPQAPGVRYLK